MIQKKFKQIYLIRHGETEPNRNHVIQGSGLDAHLNAHGFQQAADFYSAYKHIPFDAIYTSALIRTKQSVSSFINARIPHFALVELNEISWGVKDGTKINAAEQIIYNSMLNDWKAGLLDRCFEKGESPNQVALRLKIAMKEINSSDFTTILMCIHGRALRILLCLMIGIPLREMEEFLHSNLCLYVLSYEDNNWKIVTRNDTSHLQI